MSANTPHPASPRRGDLRTRRGALIGVGVLILFGVIGGTIAACGEAAAPASPTATPRPTATPVNPNASAPAYKAAVIAAIGGVSQAWDKFRNDCNEQDITTTTCRNDLQAVHDAVVNGQSTVSQHPAPPCMKAADARVREALSDYHDGVTLIRQGVESGDTGSIQVGGDMLTDGNNELAHAQVEMSQAVC